MFISGSLIEQEFMGKSHRFDRLINCKFICNVMLHGWYNGDNGTICVHVCACTARACTLALCVRLCLCTVYLYISLYLISALCKILL